MNNRQNIIAILEDNPDRVEIMRGVAASLPGNFKLRHFDNVGALQVSDLLHVRLISLDFNLDNSSVEEPGTGMDAVEFLIKRQTPVCPVIVHTSSAGDSHRMAEALTGKNWLVKQVSFGRFDRAEKWRVAAMELMGLYARPIAHPSARLD